MMKCHIISFQVFEFGRALQFSGVYACCLFRFFMLVHNHLCDFVNGIAEVLPGMCPSYYLYL